MDHIVLPDEIPLPPEDDIPLPPDEIPMPPEEIPLPPDEIPLPPDEEIEDGNQTVIENKQHKRQSSPPLQDSRSKKSKSDQGPADKRKRKKTKRKKSKDLHCDEDDNEQEPMTEEQVMLARLMGFSSFNSTKGKMVPDNQSVGAVHVVKKQRCRQYMNRKGGFNRPLDKTS